MLLYSVGWVNSLAFHSLIQTQTLTMGNVQPLFTVYVYKNISSSADARVHISPERSRYSLTSSTWVCFLSATIPPMYSPPSSSSSSGRWVEPNGSTGPASVSPSILHQGSRLAWSMALWASRARAATGPDGLRKVSASVSVTTERGGASVEPTCLLVTNWSTVINWSDWSQFNSRCVKLCVSVWGTSEQLQLCVHVSQQCLYPLLLHPLLSSCLQHWQQQQLHLLMEAGTLLRRDTERLRAHAQTQTHTHKSVACKTSWVTVEDFLKSISYLMCSDVLIHLLL